MSVSIQREQLGVMDNGQPLLAFTMKREGGLRARVLSYGGILEALWVPDRSGSAQDVILGLHGQQYPSSNPACFGAIVGRFANRIAHGRFILDGKRYQLPCNEEHAHLHGGPDGFSSRSFTVTTRDGRLVLTRSSPDGEMGYPGTLSLTVEISLTPEGGIRYDYAATTDQDTIVNLTAHPYFNLAGHYTGTIREHLLQIQAEAFLPTHPQTLTPTGILTPVTGTPFDFQQLMQLGQQLDAEHPQLKQCSGFDHTFVLTSDRDTAQPAATLIDVPSGRRMDVYTDQPGIQVYTGNFLDTYPHTKDGAVYRQHAGVCLETQHFPDSPNIPEFPSTLLNKGEWMRTWTEYRFTTVADGPRDLSPLTAPQH